VATTQMPSDCRFIWPPSLFFLSRGTSHIVADKSCGPGLAV
jgi:hypothetical protein